jgi:hypothetical protein
MHDNIFIDEMTQCLGVVLKYYRKKGSGDEGMR